MHITNPKTLIIIVVTLKVDIYLWIIGSNAKKLNIYFKKSVMAADFLM